ncbi:MAG: hypothetical protein H7Z42_19540, partial [Roseiflexaceae bacterium]|nr:hypothetical protein [Roseiflexaceae bacterium]
MNTITALLLDPGLLFLLGLTALYAALVRRSTRLQRLRLPRPSFESATSLVSVLLAALGLALLPWPRSPLAEDGLENPLLAWLAFEGAFLLPLLPGLLAGDALTNRTTLREAQIGLAGRTVVWLAAGTLLWSATALSPTAAIGWALLSAAAALALPAATGFGPFAADRALTPSGAEHGLDA